jgi:hypothetical protein
VPNTAVSAFCSFQRAVNALNLRSLNPLMLFAFLLAVLSTSFASAQQLILRNGARLDGEILRRPAADDAAGAYVIRVHEGILLRLEAKQVARIVELSPEETQYQQILPRMPDTAEGHAKMARWCQEKRLDDLKTYHWEQVVRHDSENAEARRMLGYNKIRGEWTRPDEFMESQGFQRTGSGWKLPQQIAAEERARQIELAEKQWRSELRTWRRWIGGKRHEEAIQRFKDVRDPRAVLGLKELLEKESDAALRELYVDLLARIKTGSAISTLVTTALTDGNLEVRLRSVDHLKVIAREDSVVGFARALGSKDNAMVNRAGVALGRLDDAAAVPALIDALVTRHESVMRPSQNIRPTFGGTSDGSAGMNGLSIGGGPKKVVQDIENKSVLDALIRLTEQNYRFSKADWKAWYVRKHSLPEGVNLRRDW